MQRLVVSVRLVGTNRGNVMQACLDGLDAVQRNILTEQVEESSTFRGLGGRWR